MAKKTLSGAKYFEALGRRNCSLGRLTLNHESWPSWAIKAYQKGYWAQVEIPKGVITKDHYLNDPTL